MWIQKYGKLTCRSQDSGSKSSQADPHQTAVKSLVPWWLSRLYGNKNEKWKTLSVHCTMCPKESNKLRTCEETGVDIRGWILILLRRWSSKVGLTRAQTDQTDEKEEESSHCCKWDSRMVFMRTRNFHLPVDKFLHANKTARDDIGEAPGECYWCRSVGVSACCQV